MKIKRLLSLILICTFMLIPVMSEALASTGDYIFNDDFSTWDLGAVTTFDSTSGTTYKIKKNVYFGHESGGHIDYMNIEVGSANGDKYIAYKTTASSKNAGAGVMIPKLTSGEVIYEIALKADNATNTTAFGQYWGYTPGTGDVKWDNGYFTYSALSNFTADANGFYHVRFVLNKTAWNSTDKSTVTVVMSDMNNPAVSRTYSKKYTFGEASNKIESISFGKIYSNTTTDTKIYVSSAKVYYRRGLNVTSFSYDDTNHQLKFKTDKTLDSTKITGMTAVLNDGSTDVSGEIISYNETTNEIVIKPELYLVPNGNYTLTLTNPTLKINEVCSEKVTYNFQMPDYEVPLTLLSSTPANKSRIKADAGKMTLNFSADVTAEELEANTTFINEKTGNSADITFTMTDSKTAEMSYGVLENNGKYVLTISDDLLSEAVSYEYYTTGSHSLKSVTPVSGEISTNLGMLKLKFGEDVTAEEVKDHISFTKASDGTPLTVSVSKVSEDIIVWIPVLTSGESYKLTVSDEFLSEKAEYEYTAKGYLGLSGLTPVSGSTIDVNEREITLDLGSDYPLSNLQQAISFVDDNLKAPKGGIVIRKDETNPTKAIVKFGRLEEKSNYHLIVSAPVLSSDSMYHYTTSGNYYIDEDFEDWTVGAVTSGGTSAFTKEGLIFGYKNTISKSFFKIVETAGGKKYLSYGNTAVADNSVGVVFPEKLYSGSVVVEMGIKGGNTGGTFKESAFDLLPYASEIPGNGAIKIDNTTRIPNFSSYTKDSDGFIQIRGKLTKTPYSAESGSKISIQYEDMENSSRTTKGISSTSKAVEAENFLNSVAFAKIYSNNDLGDTVDLDFVKVYFAKYLDVINTLEDFNPENRQIELIFTDDITEESLKKNTITISNDNHTVTTEFVSYSDRRAVLNLSEHLNFGENYTISFDGLEKAGQFDVLFDKGVTFKTASKPLEIISENVTTDAQNTVYSFTVKNSTNASKTFVAALLLYNEEGEVKAIKAETFTVGAGENLPEDVTVAETQFTKSKKFIWDITDKYIPIN